MQSTEFTNIRNYLGKSQSELSRLLCVSVRTIQSYEQGLRNIPPGTERQLLLLLSLKKQSNKNTKPCWKIKRCSAGWRKNCSAWEFKAGQLCWFISGTYCEGKLQKSWSKKIKICQTCKVFKSGVL